MKHKLGGWAFLKCDLRTYYYKNTNCNIKIKITVRYHFMPVRMAAIQNLQAINAGEGVEKREPSYTVGGNAN